MSIQGIGKRDSTRTQNDRCTLRSRRLHPLKQQVHQFGFIIPCFREWHKCLRHHENQLANTEHQQRDSTRNQNDHCTLRSRRLHLLKQQVHPFSFLIPCFREWHTCLRHHENQLAKTTHQQRDFTRNPNEPLCAEIQATPPFSSTGFSLRLVCSDNCWQQVQPPNAPRNPTKPLCAEIQAIPPSRAQDAALMYVLIIVGNRFSLRLLHATQQNCCVLRSSDSTLSSTRFSLKYIPTIVGNRCSLRLLYATQHNRYVLKSRRLRPL